MKEARAGRTYGAKTAEERRAERRDQIVRAALGVYGEIGYHNATVRSICAAAGLTERYFYESFSNGEDLLRECFLSVSTDLLGRMRAAADGSARPTGDRIRDGLLVYFQQLQHNPGAARVFLIEMPSISPAMEAVASASLDQFGSLLIDILEAEAGSRAAASPLLLRGVVGGGLHIAQAWIASGCAETIDHVADLTLRLYSVAAGT